MIGWGLALAGLVAATGLVDGAELRTALGLGRTSLAFPGPASPYPPPVPVVPIAASNAPWTRPVGGGNGGTSTGTLARWDGQTFLVTASHAVNFLPVIAWMRPGLAPPALRWLSPDGAWLALPAGRVSYQWDLAVYPVAAAPPGVLELAAVAPPLGEIVRFTGYPTAAEKPWAASGPVLAVTPHQNGGAAAMVVAVAAEYGQSGGALTDNEGRLAGIGVAKTPFGLLAVGNGAVRETLSKVDQLPPVQPAFFLRLAAWLAAAVGVVVCTVAVDGVLRRVR